jgi:hypothetical protein
LNKDQATPKLCVSLQRKHLTVFQHVCFNEQTRLI